MTSDAGDPQSQHLFESLGRKLDDLPELQRLEQALSCARAELDAVQARYHALRSEAAGQLRNLREKKASDLLSDSLEMVSRHPGKGLIAALLAGLFFGRFFRR